MPTPLLCRAGLWAEADQSREDVRQRLRAEKKTKQEAVTGAWDAMCENFVLLAAQGKPAFQTILPDTSSEQV